MAPDIPSLRITAKRLGRRALDLLYPPLCASCRHPVTEPHNLCAACWQAISFLDGPGCLVCGYPFEFDVGADTLCAGCLARRPAFDRARSVMRYDDKSRDLVLAFKRGDRLDLAPAFGKWLARAGRELIEEADILVPVPLHPMRLWSRRFNQSALLAHALAEAGGRVFDALVLERTRRTPSQGEMPSAKARRRNVLGAFRIARPDLVNGQKILLLDDVYTTGATLEACARVLRRAMAARVTVLTLARVVRPASRDI